MGEDGRGRRFCVACEIGWCMQRFQRSERGKRRFKGDKRCRGVRSMMGVQYV